MKKRLTYLFLLSLLASCGDNNGSEVYHPVEEYIPHINEVIAGGTDNVMSLQDTAIISKVDSSFALILGGASDKNFNFFGDITDVDTDSAGNIYILDDKTYTVRLLDKHGNPTSVYGGLQGRGPTDLYRPTAIEVDDEGFIYIADAFRQIKVLKNDGGTIEFHANFDTREVMPTDICKIEDELFVRSLANDPGTKDSLDFKTVFVYSSNDGTYKRSFGDIYRSPRTLANKFMSGGYSKIECIEEKNIVITHFEKFQYLYGYDTQGVFQWVTKLEPFTISKTIESVVDGRAVRWRYGGPGSYISTLSNMNDKVLLVQTRVTDSDAELKIIDHWINIDSGSKLVNKLNRDRFFVVEIDENKVYGKRVADYAQLEIRRRNN